jgi:hypothetical protein
MRAHRTVRPNPRFQPFPGFGFVGEDRVLQVRGHWGSSFLPTYYLSKLLCQGYNRHGKDCGKLPKTSGMQPFATPAALDQGVGSLARSDGRIDANWTKAGELAANLS